MRRSSWSHTGTQYAPRQECPAKTSASSRAARPWPVDPLMTAGWASTSKRSHKWSATTTAATSSPPSTPSSRNGALSSVHNGQWTLIVSASQSLQTGNPQPAVPLQ